MSLLNDILEQKRVEILQLRKQQWQPATARPKASMRATDHLNLIAEIKPASPSAGWLNQELSIEERALAYESGGADMISVLCDQQFFHGSFTNLKKARNSSTLPLLAKEFVLDEVQLEVAAHFGASLVLLIVRCLEQAQLQHLVASSRELGMEPLVEVFTEAEAERAIKAGATSIGVNARDLDSLEMDKSRAQRVIQVIPAAVNRYYFSGVKEPADLEPLKSQGLQGALIGEVLMRTADPASLLGRLSESC